MAHQKIVAYLLNRGAIGVNKLQLCVRSHIIKLCIILFVFFVIPVVQGSE